MIGFYDTSSEVGFSQWSKDYPSHILIPIPSPVTLTLDCWLLCTWGWTCHLETLIDFLIT